MQIRSGSCEQAVNDTGTSSDLFQVTDSYKSDQLSIANLFWNIVFNFMIFFVINLGSWILSTFLIRCVSSVSVLKMKQIIVVREIIVPGYIVVFCVSRIFWGISLGAKNLRLVQLLASFFTSPGLKYRPGSWLFWNGLMGFLDASRSLTQAFAIFLHTVLKFIIHKLSCHKAQ